MVDATTEHFIFQLTGRTSKIEQFIAIMQPMGLVEVCRTGVAALGRGAGGVCRQAPRLQPLAVVDFRWRDCTLQSNLQRRSALPA